MMADKVIFNFRVAAEKEVKRAIDKYMQEGRLTMADHSFAEVMRQWKRMCKAYSCDDAVECCNGCPITKLSADGCDAIYTDFPENASWNDAENVIMAWAAENPEPQFPSWYRWLIMMGAVGSVEDLFSDLQRPIPADIAQKLGIRRG